MPANVYVIVPIVGLRRSERRAIAFLACSGNEDLDAVSAFGELDNKRSKELRTRFDHWIDGLFQDKYFHGWPNVLRHKECFVFKWKVGRLHNRLYGFLFNPREAAPRFQACILCFHAIKKEHETDEVELDRAIRLRSDLGVIAAIRKAFCVGMEENKVWLH